MADISTRDARFKELDALIAQEPKQEPPRKVEDLQTIKSMIRQRRLKVSPTLVYARVKRGWDIEDALTKPKMTCRGPEVTEEDARDAKILYDSRKMGVVQVALHMKLSAATVARLLSGELFSSTYSRIYREQKRLAKRDSRDEQEE